MQNQLSAQQLDKPGVIGASRQLYRLAVFAAPAPADQPESRLAQGVLLHQALVSPKAASPGAACQAERQFEP